MAVSVNHVLAQVERWTAARTVDVPDAELLRRYAQERDQAAFTALVARHGAMVLRVCRRILGDVHAADDAFQAVFLILSRKAHSLKRPEALPAWLYGVARRVALKARCGDERLACRGTTEPVVPTLLDPHPDALTQLTARELLDVLDDEIRRLPAAQRSAMILCCLEGRTREEAACILGWTPGAVKGHLQRGRQRLQDRLVRRRIALSAALAVAAVSRGEAVSTPMLRNTVKAALGGGSGTSAAALAHSVLKTMFWAKFAGATTLALTVALAASATVAFFYREPAEVVGWVEERDPPSEAGGSRNETHPTTEASRKLDAFGDPLPEGAIARLGTVRFRHGGIITFLSFTPDGKRLISKGIDGVRVWDSATGKTLWHLPLAANSDWRTVDLSPDGKRLAVIAPGGNAIELSDVETGKKLSTLGTKSRPPVRFSPDGKLLAVAAGLAEFELWDLAGKKRVRSWKDNELGVQVRSLVFSDDSKRLLSSNYMGMVHLWDAASGRKLQKIEPLCFDPAVVTPVSSPNPAFSADGTLMAILESRLRPLPTPIANPQAVVSLWDTASGKLVRQLACPSRESGPGYVEPFHSLARTPDGQRLVTTGPDEFLREWDPTTGQETRRLSLGKDRRLTLIAFSKDGKRRAEVVGGSSTIQIVDAARDKPVVSWDAPVMGIQQAVLTPDGRTALTEWCGNSALVWDVATGRVKRRLEGDAHCFRSLQLARDGRTLLSTGWDKTVRLWNLESGEERRRIKVEGGVGWSRTVVTADGKTVFDVDEKRTIRVLDAATGKERRQFQLEELSGMIASADGRSLLASSMKGTLRHWDVASGRIRRDYALPVNEGNCVLVYRLAISPDGRLLAVGNPRLIGAERPKRHFLLLKDLETGQDVFLLRDLSTGTDILAFSPDGRMLAWGELNDPMIRLLETASGHERLRFLGHRGPVQSLAFSADGERLISGSMDTTALIWDLSSCFKPRNPIIALSPRDLVSLWSDLASDDAVRAYRSIRKLAASPTAAVPFLRDHLHPVAQVEDKRLMSLITDLDSDDFDRREKATVELQKIGELAEPAYRKALGGKPSLESRRRLEELLAKAHRAWWDASGERLRSLRAVEVLELAGTGEARDVLKTLAAGANGARLTEEAKAAQQRLAKK